MSIHGRGQSDTHNTGCLTSVGRGERLVPQSYPPLSIGVVTHERADAFSKLLTYLKFAIKRYPATCELVVANNSGQAANALIRRLVEASNIESVCNVQLLDSPENSISVGRNLVLDHASEPLLVFVDDDEYPVETWLLSLMDTMRKYDCELVAGPIIPVYPTSAAAWIRSVDLHNTQALKSGDTLDYAATGNFLINREGVDELRFATAFGMTGGEDTEYFLRLKDRGLVMRWCSAAIVHEDIPENKANAKYMIHRFMTQGRNYRNIREQRDELGSVVWFYARALTLAVVALVVSSVFLMVRPEYAGNWIKRGFANLGKIVPPVRALYE